MASGVSFLGKGYERMNWHTVRIIQIDVLGLIIGYSFGGIEGTGYAAIILLLWTLWAAI